MNLCTRAVILSLISFSTSMVSIATQGSDPVTDSRKTVKMNTKNRNSLTLENLNKVKVYLATHTTSPAKNYQTAELSNFRLEFGEDLLVITETKTGKQYRVSSDYISNESLTVSNQSRPETNKVFERVLQELGGSGSSTP